MLRHACRLSLEGLVSKQRDAAYPAGRTRSWIKSKCSDRQEFVDRRLRAVLGVEGPRRLAGARLPQGRQARARRPGRHRLQPRRWRATSSARLEPLRRKTSPFAEKLTADAARGVIWVKPELVAEVEFRAWTADGILRHAAFRGLREDKPAREIIREAPRRDRPRRRARRSA